MRRAREHDDLDRGLLPSTVQSGQSTTGVGTAWRAADPSVAYSAKSKRWLIDSTALSGTGGSLGLLVNRSSDGTSGSQPIVAHAAGSGDAPENASVACDNWVSSKGYGNCYLAYDNTGSSPANQLQVVTSSDGGASWSAPVGTPDASIRTAAGAGASRRTWPACRCPTSSAPARG
jgi:hypothetical protein